MEKILRNYEFKGSSSERMPVWEDPTSGALYDWYKSQIALQEDERSEEFRKFISGIENGDIKLPFDLASFDIRIQREKQRKSEE